MGQMSSSQADPTKASNRSIRSRILKSLRHYTVSDCTVDCLHNKSEPKHQNTSCRSDAEGTKSSLKHLRDTNSKAKPDTMHKEHSVKYRRTILLKRKQTTPDQWYYHEGGPARHHGIKAIRALDSNSSSSQYVNPQKKECAVCTDSRSISRFPTHPPTARCAHDADVCRRCLRTWISTTFATKNWDEISCPTCSEYLNYEEVHEFAPPDVFRKYEKLSIKAALESIPGFHWCITKGCKSGQVHEEATSKFRCVKCMKIYCTKHGTVWHKGETCKEFDYRTNKKIKRDEEKLSKKLIKEIAKICPGCKRPVEKSYGCDHMTCTKCRKEFCWQCLALYVKKDSQKLVTHRNGCFYSTDNLRRASGIVWEDGFY